MPLGWLEGGVLAFLSPFLGDWGTCHSVCMFIISWHGGTGFVTLGKQTSFR